jgi:hypothetical protein
MPLFLLSTHNLIDIKSFYSLTTLYPCGKRARVKNNVTCSSIVCIPVKRNASILVVFYSVLRGELRAIGLKAFLLYLPISSVRILWRRLGARSCVRNSDEFGKLSRVTG